MTLGRRIASDIGGTFTDIAYIGDDGRLATGKLPSTPENYADGVVRGIVELLRRQAISSEQIDEVLHGCTVATNAILEHKGARTALLTTAGFRDVLELRRIRVPRLYEPLYVKPRPLVPRRWRFEIDERIAADGSVVKALDEASVEHAIEALAGQGIEAVAVSFLHSYANPSHERRVGELLAAALPDLFISLSVDVLPEIREYERTSTTVINAYVGPPVKTYIETMQGQLSAAGLPERLLVMQSSGGILDAATAVQRPAQIVECGPAAGVIGALQVGRRAGFPNLITFDMGGTTAKAAIIEDGALSHSDAFEVGGGLSGGSALGGGGGYALKLPAIDISEVGAGGGSLVWLDKAGSMKVGPESAGAVPGPACYGLGGEQPTVSDANVVLGFLNPEALAGGSVPIRAELSREAIERQIARPLGRAVLETAFGVHTVANATMMRAVKAVTTYRGRDPRAFSLFAFGGNGGVHGVDLARVLQIREVIVPPAAGVFSAVGLLYARQELNLSKAFLYLLEKFPRDIAEAGYDELSTAIARHMDRPEAAIVFERQADMRYHGQAFELTVTLPDGPLDAGLLAELAARFEAEHEQRYGHRFAGAYPLELVNLRLVGRLGEASAPPAIDVATTATAPRQESREVYFGPEFGPPLRTPIVSRAEIGGRPRSGPLIVEEYDSTTVVPPDCEIRRDEHGNLVVGLPPVARKA